MHEFDFADYLIKRYRASIEVRKETLLNGRISNMEQYKGVVGEITGLSLAIDEIQDLLKKLEK